jgi:hypothetical protein
MKRAFTSGKIEPKQTPKVESKELKLLDGTKNKIDYRRAAK